ncbi:MAG TPA: universal stress protein [Longimicrobium sp.]
MSDRIRTIVAGVSPPAADDPTLAAAAGLARWTGAELHLVLAFSVPPVLGPPELGYMPPGWAAGQAEALRARLQAAARQVPGAESAVCHAVAGAPDSAILETAEGVRADLLVVGAARPGRLGPFLGTTAQRVLRGAGAPVLVVRRPLHRPLGRVLLTTDLSELSAAVHDQGLRTAAELFGAAGALRALLVLPYLIVPSPLPREAVERAALDELRAFLAARRSPAAVEPVVRDGAPGDEIAAEARAWNADLLVVGTHARGWAARLVLGSVAEAAVRDAPCNVLAIPPRALAAGAAADGAAAGAPEDGHARGEEPAAGLNSTPGG